MEQMERWVINDKEQTINHYAYMTVCHLYSEGQVPTETSHLFTAVKVSSQAEEVDKPSSSADLVSSDSVPLF